MRCWAAGRSIQLHPSAADLQAALAATAAGHYANTSSDGERVAVVVDTRDQAAAVNAAIRDRLVTAGRVDDTHATTTTAGQRIGVGDRIATRRNDRAVDVANRDTWTVSTVDRHGQLTVTNADAGQRQLQAGYVRRHVELAYATTAHGVQGDTVTAAHVVVGEHTGAASAYVAMTRGRSTNTAHLVADDIDDARDQWVAVFARDRADLGAAHAGEQAARDAANYAQPRPLNQVLDDLHDTWAREAPCLERLDRVEPRRDMLREIVVLRRDQPAELATAEDRYRSARTSNAQATSQLKHAETLIAGETEGYRDRLLAEWDADRDPARQAADLVNRGGGPLGLRLPAVNRAREELARWSVTWQPYLPDMPTTNQHIAHYAARSDNQLRIRAAFENHAHQAAPGAHPERRGLAAAAQTADTELTAAWRDLTDTRHRHESQLGRYGALGHTADPDTRLTRIESDVTATRGELDAVQQHIGRLTTDPAIRALPAGRLANEHDLWRAGYDSQREFERHEVRLAAMRADNDGDRRPGLGLHDRDHHYEHRVDFGHDHGPSIDR